MQVLLKKFDTIEHDALNDLGLEVDDHEESREISSLAAFGMSER